MKIRLEPNADVPTEAMFARHPDEQEFAQRFAKAGNWANSSPIQPFTSYDAANSSQSANAVSADGGLTYPCPGFRGTVKAGSKSATTILGKFIDGKDGSGTGYFLFRLSILQ